MDVFESGREDSEVEQFAENNIFELICAYNSD